MAKKVKKKIIIKYNGNVKKQKKKKIYPGDIVEFNGESVTVTNDN